MSGVVVWLTGLPAAGKSTLAERAAEKLRERGVACCTLDGDAVRTALVPTPGYDDDARSAFYETLARFAALLAEQGLTVLVPATAHRRRYRERARELAPRFLEVHVDVAPEDCADRDRKGLYAAAERGEAPELPGASVPYEPPLHPDVWAAGGHDEHAVDELVRTVASGERAAAPVPTVRSPAEPRRAATVREIMSAHLLTIAPDDELRLAVQMMLWGGCRHLPVVAGGVLVGMLTDRDVYAAQAQSGVSGDTAVGEIMRRQVDTVAPELSIADAAVLMARQGVRSLPVIERGRLVGLVTSSDLLWHVGQSLEPRRAARATVSDVMSPDPLVAHPDDELRDAVALMLEHRIRHLPVVDSERRVVGIVSDRDLRARLGDPLAAMRDEDPALRSDVLVADAMTPSPITIPARAPVTELARYLRDERVGAVPVVDDDDCLVGIVSYVDVLVA